MLPEILGDGFCVCIGLAIAGLCLAMAVLVGGFCVFIVVTLGVVCWFIGVTLGVVVYDKLLSPFFRLILRKAFHSNKLKVRIVEDD